MAKMKQGSRQDAGFLREAIRLAAWGVAHRRGGPFGAVVVRAGRVIGRGYNRVTSRNDPTAHAEIVAIRAACRRLGSFQLQGCTVYSSCEPCPMCLGALYWARPARVVYACTRRDAAEIGFDDSLIYRELRRRPGMRRIPERQLLRTEALAVFRLWTARQDRQPY